MEDRVHCDYCDEEAAHPVACRDCQTLFCQRHYKESEHNCGEAVVTLRLPNGSIYDMPIPPYLQGVYEALDRKENSLFSMLFQTLLGSPVTLGFLLIMWVWTATEFLWLLVYGASPLWNAVFILTSEQPLYVWTWVTSIFSHGGALHLAVNSFVLASFGPLVERYLGGKRYIGVLLLGGIIAGLAQIGVSVFTPETIRVVGASGAIAAVLGIYATAEPDVPVYFLFVIPMPIWITVSLIILGSIGIVITYGVLAFNIAHVAHAAGALFGVAVGLAFNIFEVESPSSRNK